MKRTLCLTAALLVAGIASAEIVVIQAEDAVSLGTGFATMLDTNVPPYAFGTNYISATNAIADYALGEETIYSVGNLSSNGLYDLYLRVHVGPGGYGDDSIWIPSAFNVTNAFSYLNGIAGRIGLDAQVCTAAGFHWIKINGTSELTFLDSFDAGAGTNLVFAIAPREDGLDVDALAFVPADFPVTDEMLNPANAGVALWSVGKSPDAPTTDTQPVIQALFGDGTETVDTNNITMRVDGMVVGYTNAYSNSVTTISYTPASPLEAGTTHTARVVVATTPSAILFTNEWIFEIQTYPIVYIDASATNTIMATSPNGPVGAGTALVTSPDMLDDGIWRFRTGYGVAPSVTNGPTGTISTGGDGTLFESSGYDAAALDNVPRLKTSVSGLASNTYAVYVYFWDAMADFTVRSGLEDLPGTNTLALITETSTNVVQVGADDGGRGLYRALLGYVTGTSIDVFIEDLPATSSQDRTWYDGIGYQKVDAGSMGPTIDPDIQSISISGGTAMLTWSSEAVGTYSIMHKTNLNDAVWTPVKTGIAGGEPTTADSVSVSGAGTEFFQIKGE